MLALYIFALDLGWFPLNHASDVDYSRRLDFRSLLLSVIQHAILPAGTIVLTSMGGWMLGMRNNMIGILSQDFIVMAQAKGLRDPASCSRMPRAQCILPSLTGSRHEPGLCPRRCAVTEIVFNYPGSAI